MVSFDQSKVSQNGKMRHLKQSQNGVLGHLLEKKFGQFEKRHYLCNHIIQPLMEEFSRFIDGTPLWFLLVFGIVYAAIFIAFVVLMVRLWRR